MLSPEYLEDIPNKHGKRVSLFEIWVLLRMSKDISEVAKQFGLSDYDVIRAKRIIEFRTEFERQTGRLEREMVMLNREVLHKAGQKAYASDAQLFDAAGIERVPYPAPDGYVHAPMGVRIYAIENEAIGNLNQNVRAIIKSSATKMINPYGNAVPIPDAYQQILDYSTNLVSSGTMTYEESIKRAVKQMAQNGITVVRYEGEGKKPVNRRIEGVVRTNVLTGVSQMADKISWADIDALGADHVVISAHDGARQGAGFKGHVNWQGRVFALNGFRP